MKYFSLLLIILLNIKLLFSQSIQLLSEGTKTSLRGLSVVDEKTIWASGSNGMVARSTDGGISFNWIKVKGFEGRDFRDIEAFDSNKALILAVSEPAIILKTVDGGKSWLMVFSDSTPGMFLDAMDFKGSSGVVVGDPIQGKVFLAETADYGDSWKILNKENFCAEMREGEAFFASSGSNVLIEPQSKKELQFTYVSGGKSSRIFQNNLCLALPLQMGKNSTGANAMAISPSGKHGILVGGDFAEDKKTDSTSVLFSRRKRMVISGPQHSLHGYRSSVSYLSEERLVACGTSGVDFSSDGGLHWKLVSEMGFHVVKSAGRSQVVFLAGSNGRIAKLRLPN